MAACDVVHKLYHRQLGSVQSVGEITGDDFKGLNKRSPWFAGIMMMLMFSMAGVPFFIGFFAKFAVLQAVVAAGYMWLAIVAVLFSLIGAFYYLRVVKVMYFDAPVTATSVIVPPVEPNWRLVSMES